MYWDMDRIIFRYFITYNCKSKLSFGILFNDVLWVEILLFSGSYISESPARNYYHTL